MSRSFVHLSTDLETAIKVGNRNKDGNTWLVKNVPVPYLDPDFIYPS